MWNSGWNKLNLFDGMRRVIIISHVEKFEDTQEVIRSRNAM
jgi:DNA repair exonuclease SbcCD ATPase subunit